MSADKGREKRDEAVNRVRISNYLWIQRSWPILVGICRKRKSFTSDDVWKAVRDRGIKDPTEPRAMGALLRSCHFEGHAEPTEQPRARSVRSVCHARPITVWISKIYEGSGS